MGAEVESGRKRLGGRADGAERKRRVMRVVQGKTGKKNKRPRGGGERWGGCTRGSYRARSSGAAALPKQIALNTALAAAGNSINRRTI